MGFKIHHPAVLGASLLGFGLAFIWYGPLFGESWAIGAEVIDPKTPPGWATLTSFLVGLLANYGLAYLLAATHQKGAMAGLKLGLLISAAFLLQVIIGPWLFAGRFLLFAVNMPYFTLVAMGSGIIIGYFQK